MKGRVEFQLEVKNMMWEVDENLDECVDWEEFKLMYERNVADKTGLALQLFNVVQFMMYDEDNTDRSRSMRRR